MIVFEMFGHLGELVFAAEAEHGAGLVDVDDALSVHAERGTAVLEHHSATRHGGLAESRRFWSKINGKTSLPETITNVNNDQKMSIVVIKFTCIITANGQKDTSD